MARAPKTPTKGKTFRIHVELPGEMAMKLDAKARELTEASEVPGEVVTRSDVIRRAIWAYVK